MVRSRFRQDFQPIVMGIPTTIMGVTTAKTKEATERRSIAG